MEYGSQTNQGDALGTDMKNAARDAGEAIKTSGQQLGDEMGERYRNARSKFQDTLSQAKDGLTDMQENVSARTRDAMDSTDQFVKEHPWQSVGIGAAVGLVVGFLMMRR
jgi:ElaB/YqjD/DUF883 family membrane-anchored ribosome-binding protein